MVVKVRNLLPAGHLPGVWRAPIFYWFHVFVRWVPVSLTIKEKGTEFQVKKSQKHPKTLNLIHFMPEKNYITFT